MSEEEIPKEAIHELPEAVVSARRHQISIVWLVPLVALLALPQLLDRGRRS